MANGKASPTSALHPVATNDRATVAVGCVVWAVLLVVCLLNSDRLESAGRGWWGWTCVAGLVLGLGGLAFLQHRRGGAAARDRSDQS